MFDTTQANIVVLRQPERPLEASAEDTLSRRCLHPAEAWAMRRRAGRPEAPSRRLPAVARAG